ncbi:MAG: hypothetical protein RR301_11030 [Clostridia bacterium]
MIDTKIDNAKLISHDMHASLPKPKRAAAGKERKYEKQKLKALLPMPLLLHWAFMGNHRHGSKHQPNAAFQLGAGSAGAFRALPCRFACLIHAKCVKNKNKEHKQDRRTQHSLHPAHLYSSNQIHINRTSTSYMISQPMLPVNAKCAIFPFCEKSLNMLYCKKKKSGGFSHAFYL